MLTWLPMPCSRCADCGAPSGAGKSCPDRLYELLVLKCREHEAQYRLALACFALQHPRTHSANCLAVARFQLESALQAAGQDPSDACPVSRWIAARLAQLDFGRAGTSQWRAFASRIPAATSSCCSPGRGKSSENLRPLFSRPCPADLIVSLCLLATSLDVRCCSRRAQRIRRLH